MGGGSLDLRGSGTLSRVYEARQPDLHLLLLSAREVPASGLDQGAWAG